MNWDFEGKVLLVTGGGSGIGRATALAFAREKARVVVSDINIQGGEETVEAIKRIGGDSIFIKTDVTAAADVETMVGRTIQNYGRLDYAHNNAGIGPSHLPTAQCSEEAWEKIINTNLKGIWLCMKYEIPEMLKQGCGAIVNTASVAGFVGTPKRPAYTASKHGVVGLTKAAALDYIKTGIRINAVCPGLIRTPMVERTYKVRPESTDTYASGLPSGRMGTPEEVAQAVLWLCSEAASYVNGHALTIDGGLITGYIL